MNLTERLAKIRSQRAQLQTRIQRKAERRQAVSFEQAKLVRETVKQIKTEMRLEKSKRSVA